MLGMYYLLKHSNILKITCTTTLTMTMAMHAVYCIARSMSYIMLSIDNIFLLS